MANNNYNQQQNIGNGGINPPLTRDQIRSGLGTTTVPLNISGMQFTEKVSDLKDKIVNAFVGSFGLEQLVSVGMEPITARDSTMVTGVEMEFYFDTTIRTENGVYISRGKRGGNFSDDNTIYGLIGVNNTMKDGGFEMSKEFKSIMAKFHTYEFASNDRGDRDKEKEIKVTSLNKNNPHIAAIKVDVLNVFDILLGNRADAYSTTVLSARSLSTGDNFDDYLITFIKNIETAKFNRKNRGSIDFNSISRQRLGRQSNHGGQSSNNGGNRQGGNRNW